MLFADFDWAMLLRPDLIWAPVAVAGILVWGVVSVIQQHHRHRERMAMIERGIHPDDPTKGQEREPLSTSG